MANEFEKILNPDNIPGAVSSGYQRQNNIIYGIMTGLDTTTPYDNGWQISIPAGRLVEYNGFIFVLTQDVYLTKPNSGGQYFIGISDNNNGTANVVLLDIPGNYIAAKNGYYNNSRRVLNWVSNGRPIGGIPDISNPSVVIFLNGFQVLYYNAKKGWYRGILRAAGGGGSFGEGGTGGYLDIFFYLNESKMIKLMSSSGGKNSTFSSNNGSGGGGGGGTVIDIGNKQFITTGGGGGSYPGNTGGGGGGGGGYGSGGGGGKGSYIYNGGDGGNGGGAAPGRGATTAGENGTRGGGMGGGSGGCGSTNGGIGGTGGGNGGEGGWTGSIDTYNPGYDGGNNIDSIVGGGGAGASGFYTTGFNTPIDSQDGFLILQYLA